MRLDYTPSHRGIILYHGWHHGSSLKLGSISSGGELVIYTCILCNGAYSYCTQCSMSCNHKEQSPRDTCPMRGSAHTCLQLRTVTLYTVVLLYTVLSPKTPERILKIMSLFPPFSSRDCRHAVRGIWSLGYK